MRDSKDLLLATIEVYLSFSFMIVIFRRLYNAFLLRILFYYSIHALFTYHALCQLNNKLLYVLEETKLLYVYICEKFVTSNNFADNVPCPSSKLHWQHLTL